jgi:hypothetical protein
MSFLREQQLTGRNAGWLQPAMDEFARAMARLLNKWEQASESDARTVQYMLGAGEIDSKSGRLGCYHCKNENPHVRGWDGQS